MILHLSGCGFPHILLSYATSEKLGIFEFKIPNLLAHSYIDLFTVPTSPTPDSSRKTAKHITFHDPLINLNQPHCTTHSQGSLWKTSLMVTFSDLVKLTTNGTQCKQPQPYNYIPYQPSKPTFPITPLLSQSQLSRLSQWKWPPPPHQWSRTSLPWSKPSHTLLIQYETCLGLIPLGLTPPSPMSSMFSGRYLKSTGNRLSAPLMILSIRVYPFMYPHKPVGTLHTA